MVTYDSKSKLLSFYYQTVINGKVWSSDSQTIDLSIFDEPVRQAIIGLTKIAINFANGHSIANQAASKLERLKKAMPKGEVTQDGETPSAADSVPQSSNV